MIVSAILIFFLFFSLALLFVISSAFFVYVITRVPFVRTSTKDVEFILSKVKILSADTFFDLGSGDGKVVFMVEKKTKAKVVGFEMGAWMYLLSYIKKIFLKSKAKFICKDFFKVSWSEANVIYCYLFPHLMGKVESKFLSDTKKGSMAIIRDFPFPNLKPQEIFYLPENHEVYIYKKV